MSLISYGNGRNLPTFGIPFAEQQSSETIPGFIPATSLPLSGTKPAMDRFWSNNLLFPADSPPELGNAGNSQELPASPTADAPASADFRDQVSERLADGMGELVQGNDRQLLGEVKTVVSQKISLASTVGISQKNPAAQVRLLMSAFGDIEWYIGNVLADFKGVQLPPEVQSFIATMRAMQASIMAQIKQVTGLKLSDDEMRALLEQDPSKVGQNISLNWLVQQDHQMKPLPNGPGNNGQPPNASPNSGNDPNDIFGIQANPGKYQAALGSANRKVVAEMQKIMQQATALMQAAARDPKGNIDKLMAAIGLLNRGQIIREVAQALDGFTPANPAEASFGATTDVFAQLIQQAREMMRQNGLPPNLLADQGGTAEGRPQAVNK